MSELKSILEAYSRKSPNSVSEDEAYTAEAISAIKKLMLEKIGEDRTEEDFLDIANPSRSASIGEFTYVKNGMNFVRAEFRGYNQAKAEVRKAVEGL